MPQKLTRKLRSQIASTLPKPWAKRARKLARTFDQTIGWLPSHWQLGSVAMLHVGRCGSTVVGNLLDQHPKIYWDGEVVFNEYVFNNCQLKPFDTKTFFRQQMLVAGNRFYGFEVKVHPEQQLAILHQTLPELVNELPELGVEQFIVLERKNYLRRIISAILGYQTKTRHLNSKSKAKLTQTRLDLDKVAFGIVYNPKPLINCLEEIDQTYRQLESLLEDKSSLWLTYEDDILPDPRIAYRKVCEFIQVEPMAVDILNQRTNPFPIREIVENYDELEAMLKGTKFEWMLTE
jgi:hypothetical protein